MKWLAALPIVGVVVWNVRPIEVAVKRVLLSREVAKLLGWILSLLSDLHEFLNRTLA